MPMFDFKCNNCGFVKEYSTNKSLPKNMWPPKKCPECNKGELEKQFSVNGQSFDVIGGFEYQYGRYAKTPENQTRRVDYLSDRTNSPY